MSTPGDPSHDHLGRLSRLIIASPLQASSVVGLLTFLAFLPAVNSGFVNWDDNSYITDNPLIQQGLSSTGIRRAFTEVVFHNWAPLTVLSYLLDATLFGIQPAGFHLTNVVLHAATACTVCLALCRMTRSVGRSAAVAALFALHPLRVESVAWVAERKDVLSMLFVGLSLLAYERFCRQPSAQRLAVVALAMLGSLLSKSTAVTLPGLLLLLDVWPLGRVAVGRPAGSPRTTGGRYPPVPIRRAVVEKLPLILLSIVFAFFTIVAQRQAISGQQAVPIVARRLPNAIYAVNWYVLKTAWPVDLHPAHMLFGAARPPWLVAACSGGLLALFGIALVCARRCPAVTVGILWFIAALVPVLGFVQAGFQAHADRFTYLPHVGLFVAVVWGALEILPPRNRRSPLPMAILTAALVACVSLDRRQIAVWKDSETLWRHVLAINPGNSFACNNLATTLAESGRGDEAIPYLKKAISLLPHEQRLQMNLEIIEAELGGSAGTDRRAAGSGP